MPSEELYAFPIGFPLLYFSILDFTDPPFLSEFTISISLFLSVKELLLLIASINLDFY
jgi:hypothetical protein